MEKLLAIPVNSFAQSPPGRYTVNFLMKFFFSYVEERRAEV